MELVPSSLQLEPSSRSCWLKVYALAATEGAPLPRCPVPSEKKKRHCAFGLSGPLASGPAGSCLASLASDHAGSVSQWAWNQEVEVVGCVRVSCTTFVRKENINILHCVHVLPSRYRVFTEREYLHAYSFDQYHLRTSFWSAHRPSW